MNQNTKAETLTQLEARGRVFATALLDAGFSASEVTDAAWAPFRRLQQSIGIFYPTETYFGDDSNNQRDFARRCAQSRDIIAKEAPAWAFVAGVLAVLEERA